jgi:hypothetical protein
LALDLCVPPLALLAASLIGATALAALVSWGDTSVVLVGVYLALLAVFVGAALVAWSVRGRDLVRLVELLSIPFYIAAKIPLYVRFLYRREKRWVRTGRDESPP